MPYAHPEVLVSTQWVLEHHKDANIRLVEVDEDFLLYEQGHVPGAVNLPGRLMTAESLAAYPQTTLWVVYCAGPHCNGANKAAAKLAALGRPVKEMIGGVTGWLDEGFSLQAS